VSELLPSLDMDIFSREVAMVCTPLRSYRPALFRKSDCSRSECSNWVLQSVKEIYHVVGLS
jgi:hypothetical protein